MTQEQAQALKTLDQALNQAADCGLLDLITEVDGPDITNSFCDAVGFLLEVNDPAPTGGLIDLREN